MKYVEVVANAGSSGTISAIAEKAKAQDFRLGVVGEDGMQQMRLLVADDKIQWVLDALQNILGTKVGENLSRGNSAGCGAVSRPGFFLAI